MANSIYQERLRRLAEEQALKRMPAQDTSFGAVGGQPKKVDALQQAAQANKAGATTPTAPAQGATAQASQAQGTGGWWNLWQAGPLVTGEATDPNKKLTYADRGITGYFKSSDGNIYNYETAPDDVLTRHGYVRGEDGVVQLMPSAKPTEIAAAEMLARNTARRGTVSHKDASPEQLAEMQRDFDRQDWERRQRIAQNRARGAAAEAAQGTGLPDGGSGSESPNGAKGVSAWNWAQGAGAPTGTVTQQNPYQAYLSQWDYEQAPQWEGSDYQARRDAALQKAEDMQWNYDPETDPVWQAYQKQYRREGDRATKNTLGNYAAMTGGVPSSYAVTAASQAGDYYASQLSDKLPELYNSAYQRYLQEFQKQLGISDQYAGFDDREYNRYRDRLSQWNTDRSFNYGAYRDAVSDDRYDQEWAQKLREYADEQGWKQKEWEQYLTEYGDQLSDKQWERAYRMARDAVEDAWNERSYEDSRADLGYERDWNENERDYSRGREAESDERTGTQWSAAMEDAALSYLETAGYVTGTYAEILGVPPGTTREQYYAMYGVPYEEQQTRYTGSGSGSGSGGGSKSSDTPAPASGGAQYDASGRRTGTWQDSDGYTYVGYHPDGQWKSKGYDGAWNEIQNMPAGTSKETILTKIRNFVIQDRITDYEAEMMMVNLGYRTTSPSVGRNSIGPNNVQMVQ